MPRGGSEPGERRGGRQKGSVNKATAEVRLLAQEHGAAVAVQDWRGCRERECSHRPCNALLDRAYGRSQSNRPVEIDIPDTSSIEGVTKAVAVIIQSAASGRSHEASDFCALLNPQRNVIELSDLDERPRALAGRRGQDR